MKNISLIVKLTFMAYQLIAAAPQYRSTAYRPSSNHNYNDQLDPHIISFLQQLFQRLATNHPEPNWTGYVPTLTPTANTDCSEEDNQSEELHYNSGFHDVGFHETPAEAAQEVCFCNSMEDIQSRPASHADKADTELYLNQGYKYLTALQENIRHHQPNNQKEARASIHLQPEQNCNDNSGIGNYAAKLPGIQINQYDTNNFEHHWFDSHKNHEQPHMSKSLHEQAHSNVYQTPNCNDETFLNSYPESARHEPIVGGMQAQEPSLKYPKNSSKNLNKAVYKNFNRGYNAGEYKGVGNSRNPILSTPHAESSTSTAAPLAFVAPTTKIDDTTNAANAESSTSTAAPLAFAAPTTKIDDTTNATNAATAQITPAPDSHGFDDTLKEDDPTLGVEDEHVSNDMTTVTESVTTTNAATVQITPAPDSHGFDDTLKEDDPTLGVEDEHVSNDMTTVTESVTTTTDIAEHNEEIDANDQVADGSHNYEYVLNPYGPALLSNSLRSSGLFYGIPIAHEANTFENIRVAQDNVDFYENHQPFFKISPASEAFYDENFSPFSTELRPNTPTIISHWSSVQKPMRAAYIRSQSHSAESQPSFAQENLKYDDTAAGWENWKDEHNSDMSDGMGYFESWDNWKDEHNSDLSDGIGTNAHIFFNFYRYI